MAKTKIFIDTNIFVYTLDGHDREKQATARSIVKDVVENQLPVISTQVLQEFYSASTTKLKIDAMIAKNIVHSFGTMEVVPVDLNIIEQGIDISILFRFSFWDSLIIAAAEQANCAMVFSEDMKDGQTVRGVRIVNPFLLH